MNLSIIPFVSVCAHTNTITNIETRTISCEDCGVGVNSYDAYQRLQSEMDQIYDHCLNCSQLSEQCTQCVKQTIKLRG